MIQLRSGEFTATQFVNTVNKTRRKYSDNSWIAINAVVAGHKVIYRAVGTFIQKLTVDGTNHEFHATDSSSFRKFIEGVLK